MTRSRNDLEDWILRARQVDSWPSMPAQARVWSAIERRIAVGPPPVSIGNVSVGSTIGASKLMVVLAIVTTIGAPLLGGIAAATMGVGEGGGESTTPTPVVAQRDPVPTRTAVSMVATSPVVHDDGPIEVFDEGSEDLDVEIFVEPETSGKRRAVRRGAAARPSDLEIETRILRGARARLRAGDVGEANALLAEHRERFPRGMLVDLRAALEIDAQCRLGHTERARALAGAFARKYPSSPYRVRATQCDPAGGGTP
jgi:hypothetical protein